MLKKDWVFRRGDIYMANLTPVCGSEQGGVRPVLIIQNNVGNYHSPTLVVATFTSKARKKTKQPTHYLMKHNPALKKPSVVLLEQIRTVDKQRIERYLHTAAMSGRRGGAQWPLCGPVVGLASGSWCGAERQ